MPARKLVRDIFAERRDPGADSEDCWRPALFGHFAYAFRNGGGGKWETHPAQTIVEVTKPSAPMERQDERSSIEPPAQPIESGGQGSLTSKLQRLVAT